MRQTTEQQIAGNPEILKRMAKIFVQQCFRNTVLEDYHARISQEEMKALMIEAVNNTYSFLWVLFDDKGGDALVKLLEAQDLVPNWNEPESCLKGHDLRDLAALQRWVRSKGEPVQTSQGSSPRRTKARNSLRRRSPEGRP